MVEKEFAEFTMKLCRFWDKKSPASETLGEWFSEVRFIPVKALPWIAFRFNELEKWPANFPVKIKSFWFQWLNDHPEHKAKEQEIGCENCHAGWITVAYIGYADQVYTTAFKCAACNSRAMPKEAPAWHLEQVIASGKFFRPIGRATHDYFDRLPELPGYDYNVTTPQATTIEGLVAQTAGRLG